MKKEKSRCQNRGELTFELHETLKQRQDNPLENQSSITQNPAISQKKSPSASISEGDFMELIPGFGPGTSSLPSCDESRASPVFRHYLLRTNSYIIITEWFRASVYVRCFFLYRPPAFSGDASPSAALHRQVQ